MVEVVVAASAVDGVAATWVVTGCAAASAVEAVDVGAPAVRRPPSASAASTATRTRATTHTPITSRSDLCGRRRLDRRDGLMRVKLLRHHGETAFLSVTGIIARVTLGERRAARWAGRRPGLDAVAGRPRGYPEDPE